MATKLSIKKSSTAPAPRKRGRPKAMPDEVQRSLIVACAGQLLLEKGYGRTTTDDVAARCRMSKQTLYRLFPNKPALFAAVVDAHRHKVLALPGDYEGLPLDEAIEKIFKIDIDTQADKERITLVLSLMIEAPQFPELWDLLRHHGIDASRAELSAWLDRQKKKGRIKIDDADGAAGMLMDMIYGRIFKTMIGSPWPAPEELRTHIRRCVAVFLHGVVPPKAG